MARKARGLYLMERLRAHRFAELFPMMVGDDFRALAEDIRENGICDRIAIFEGEILDGRNRYAALVYLTESGEVLGEGWGHRQHEPLTVDELDPGCDWFRRFNPNIDGDPLTWVMSKNLQRRHLDESQRAMVAAKLSNLEVGRPIFEPAPPHTPPIDGISAQVAARMMNVGTRSVERAKAVMRDGSEELQREVEQGRVAVSVAESLSEMSKDDQAQIIARGEAEILAAAKTIRSRKRTARFAEVNEKLLKISEGSKPLPTGQKYPIIYADPATKYVSGFGDRSIENHYPTMTTEELCALPVGDLATDDAVLFVWTTIPQLRNTMTMIEAWGFKYVSAWCWDKVDHGTGHWAFNQHEELLIATRGNFPAPIPGTQPTSLYHEKKTDHSVKPSYFAERIEAIWPTLPKIELFTRSGRAGWSVWGNQADRPEENASEAEAPAADNPTQETPAESAFVDGRLIPWFRFAPIEGPCCEPDCPRDDMRADAPVGDDPLDIPAFLRRSSAPEVVT
jgi:N6-adenosine-specific RNA methylase IME4